MQLFKKILLSWFGCGFSPIAPGTVGSFFALPFAWIISFYFEAWGLIISSILLTVIGYLSVRSFKDSDKDPQWIVADEVVGQWLTISLMQPSILIYSLGFILFRVFDIFKPWPIKNIEKKFANPLGIFADDIVAAGYAAIMLYLVKLLLER